MEMKKEEFPSEGGFTASERMLYYRRKWERDHLASLVAGILLLAVLFCVGLILNNMLSAAAVLLACVFSVIRYNKKMAYAEWKAYVEPRPGSGKEKQ